MPLGLPIDTPFEFRLAIDVLAMVLAQRPEYWRGVHTPLLPCSNYRACSA